jgi:hypothetical protein
MIRKVSFIPILFSIAKHNKIQLTAIIQRMIHYSNIDPNIQCIWCHKLLEEVDDEVCEEHIDNILYILNRRHANRPKGPSLSTRYVGRNVREVDL